MISLFRSSHLRFGHNERYHLAVVFTILVVAWVAVPLVVQFVDVAIVWLTFVPARGPRRHSPPR
jgi:hypothetical protein